VMPRTAGAYLRASLSVPSAWPLGEHCRGTDADTRAQPTMTSILQHMRAAASAVQSPATAFEASGNERSRVATLRTNSSAVRNSSIRVASANEAGGYVMNGVEISAIEAFFFNYFGKDSPVIPGGVFITSCILASGLFSLQQKNRSNQQYAMRARVVGQGITIGAMMTSLVVMERQKALGIIPKYRDGSS